MAGIVTLFLSLIGGILPALLWLYVWLRNDTRPEPRQRLIRAFLGGMMCVPISVVSQMILAGQWFETTSLVAIIERSFFSAAAALLLWAFIEELIKYGMAFFSVLNSKDNDEPIDPVIYMITVALGFAAMENALYLIQPLLEWNPRAVLDEGFARVIGATLIHVSSSAVVGMAYSFTMFAFARFRIPVRIIGLLCATALHASFNLLIISNEHLYKAAYALVWTACIALVVLFEKIKQVHLNTITTNEEA